MCKTDEQDNQKKTARKQVCPLGGISSRQSVNGNIR